MIPGPTALEMMGASCPLNPGVRVSTPPRRAFEALRHAEGRLAVEVTADIERHPDQTPGWCCHACDARLCQKAGTLQLQCA